MVAEDQNAGFFKCISEEGLCALQSLVGKAVHRIHSPCLQVAGQHFTSPSWSIPVSVKDDSGWHHSYVVIRCEWYETPELLTDYWQISASNEKKPEGIPIDATGAIVAPCTINLWHASPISSVEVYRFEWISEGIDPSVKEHVSYDNAIRFRSTDGKSFCIACQLNGPGIATEVHLSEDEKVIEEFLRDSTLRLSLT